MIGRRRFGLGAAALAISTGAHAQSREDRAARCAAGGTAGVRPASVGRERHAGTRGTGLRHAVQLGRRHGRAAADGGDVEQVRRWPAVQLHAAPRPEVPRPHSGDVARCRRDAAATAGARYAEPDSRQPGGGAAGQGRQDVHAAAQGAIPLRRVPAVRQQRRDGRHHAREGCADRSVHAGEGAHRLRPVPLRRERVSARQQAGLREVCRIRPARRTCQRLCRRQARFGRSRRVDDHAGRCGCLCGAASGRGGFPRCAAAGPAAHRGERQQHRHRRRVADRDLCRAALQFAVAAIRQREGAPGRRACGEPARLHVGRVRRPEILARVLRVLDLRQS